MKARFATPEEIKQREEEYKVRKQYWHLLLFIDGDNEGDATAGLHLDDMPVILERIKPYDLSSTCDLWNHRCTCNGAGIRKR